MGGLGEFKVLFNTAEASEPDYLRVEGLLPDTAAGLTYYLRDDDEESGFKEGVNLEDAISGRIPVDVGNACYVAARYQHAYIIPEFNTLKSTNRRRTTDYVRNLQSYNDIYRLEELNQIYRFDNRATEASEDFWTVYILSAHKGATYEDSDPDDETALEGIIDNANIGVVIFLEGINERIGHYEEFDGRSGEQDCIAHEIGHLFGSVHEDEGLMGDGRGQNAAFFSKVTLDRIRSAKHP